MKFWIARDENGALALHESEPYCRYDKWHNGNQEWVLDQSFFPEVTFENSPQEIEIKLVENLKMTQNKHEENIKDSIELLNLYKQCWEKIDFLTKIKSTYGDMRISDVIENLEYQAVKFKNKFENLITKE